MSKRVILTAEGFKIIDEKKPTVFDHITQSVETLAEKLVYRYCSTWRSFLLQGYEFLTKAEAIAATVEELKKEWSK
jgi:hypothetical protein